MTIYDQIIEKLQQNASSPTIIKFFTYTIEELQDNPQNLESIVEYLQKHKDKWESFDIRTWIDEETFKPVIMIEITPIASLRKNINTSRIQKMINYYETQKNNELNNETQIN
jgi:viroplasmin and RNaseH domain-containing protein